MLRLAPYIGAGTLANPHRPRGVDGVPGWSAIDLRRPGAAAGRALVWYPPGTPGDAQMDDLANDPTETITAGRRTALLGRLGVASLTATRWDLIVGELLMNPPVNGWNRLQPAGARYEVHLGGRVWFQQASGASLPSLFRRVARAVLEPRLAEATSATDSFTRANETPIASPWIEIHSTGGAHINLVSNAITSGAAGITAWAYSGAASSADQYSSAKQISAVTDDSWGPILRAQAGFETYYAFRIGDIYKVESGSLTLVATLTGAVSNADRLHANAVGSTLRLYRNTTEISGSPGTDTGISAANPPGLWLTNTGGSLDDFDGGDGTGIAAAGGSRKLLLLGVGSVLPSAGAIACWKFLQRRDRLMRARGWRP